MTHAVIPERQESITHICLDLDGTLAHSIPAMRASYDRFLARFDIQGTQAEFDELNGPTLRQIVAILKRRYSLQQAPGELLDDYTASIAAAYSEMVQPMPGARQAMQGLKKDGHSLILVTANVRAIASGFVSGQSWDAFFEFCIFGDDVTTAKPAPDIYLKALGKAGALPGRTAAVEDSPNGIRAAAAAGVLPIGFAANPQTVESLKLAGALHIIERLEALPSLIRSLTENAP